MGRRRKSLGLHQSRNQHPRKQRQTLWLLSLCSMGESERTVVSYVGVQKASQPASTIRLGMTFHAAASCFSAGGVEETVGCGRFSDAVY